MSAPLLFGDHVLAFGRRTHSMAILNVTDDSFSGDGVLGDMCAAVGRGIRFAEYGAAIVDVGGESARTGVRPLTPEEIARVCPVIERLARECDAVISIDSYKPAVVKAAIRAGARPANDIGGSKLGSATAAIAARHGMPLVINYTYERRKIRPAPPPRYDDVVGEHRQFFRERIQTAIAWACAAINSSSIPVSHSADRTTRT